MAGGTWTSQNKVRPGAYINFKAVPKGSMTVGDRGVVAMALPLNWGKNGQLIEVLSSDLLNGESKKLVGFTAFDADSKILASALKYCYKALVYRADAGGTKATATIGKLTCTAKYAGTLGNSINITISKDASNIYTVITYLNGSVVDSQKVAAISELENTDWIDFTEEESGSFIETAGTPLTGGANGTVSDSTIYGTESTSFLSLLEMARWQTLAVFFYDTYTVSSNPSLATMKGNLVAFINRMRNDEGRYVQGVVPSYDAANSEGVINNVCGAVINGITFTVEEFVAVVAGMTAGADINESNTAKVIEGATSIVGEMTDAQIKAALSAGKFVLSTSTSGNIKVEQDINSLHNYSSDQNYSFSKNRVIRVLDEIGTTVKETWEDSYMGKIDNNEAGRGLFKTDIIVYFNELMRIGAIQNFETDDIVVRQGVELDAVVVDLYVQPVDSMEKLYMTVNVSS